MVCAGSRAPEEASQATHAYHAIASSVERTSRGGCFCRGDARRGKGRRPKGGHVANTVACVAIISLCTKVRAPPGLDPSASVQHRGFARTPLATVAKRKLRRVRSSGCGAFCARRSAGGRRSSSSCDCKHVFENFVYALIRCGSKQQDSPAMEHGTVNTRLQRLNCRSILSSPKTRLQKPRRFLSHAIHQSSFFTPRRTRMMMKPDESSAEVASRAIEATEAATAASTEAASLETTVALERAALRARRDRDVCQGDATKTRAPSDGPRTPTEANARARRTKEAENETRRARETARMRAAGLGPPGERVGDGSARDWCGSEFALDEKARESWQRHELQWARFEADNDLISDDTDDDSPRRRLTLHDVPFPSSGSGLLVSLVAFGVGGETSAQNQNGKIVEKEKAAASLAVARRVAAMRWHPDKFTQKFGKRLAVVMSATDRAEVDRIVVETYQDIQRTFQSLTRSK